MKNNVMVALVSGAIVSLGAITSVQAQTQLTNPWSGDGAEVDININVGQIGEVWSSVGTGQEREGDSPLVLEITNGAGNIPAEGRKLDVLNHYANVDYEIYVDLGDGDIPEFSRFHVLVDVSNSNSYDAVAGGGSAGATEALAANTITWDRRDSGTGYLGGNNPGTPVLALTDSMSNLPKQTNIEYAADAIHGLPSQSVTDFDVVWTIAAN